MNAVQPQRTAQPTFERFGIDGGLVFESAGSLASRLHTWSAQRHIRANVGSAWFGYVFDGTTRVEGPHNSFELVAGQYFCLPEIRHIEGGRGVLFERVGARPMAVVGGPIEANGRLAYIDGCRDSLLVPPSRRGEACLNALYFPRGIDQTPHTHPSIRFGVVVRGRGVCRLPSKEVALNVGDVFVIREEGTHSFRTTTEDELVVIAYHPDSDFGPQDQEHPMINRTFVDGVSAAHLEHLQT